MVLPESKVDLPVLEDEEGDIDEILNEEEKNIKEKHKKEIQELIQEHKQYAIKVRYAHIHESL